MQNYFIVVHKSPNVQCHNTFIAKALYFSAWENFTGHNTPLYGRHEEDDINHPGHRWNLDIPIRLMLSGYFSRFNLNDSISYYLNHGVPKEQIVVGMATFGHSWVLKVTRTGGQTTKAFFKIKIMSFFCPNLKFLKCFRMNQRMVCIAPQCRARPQALTLARRASWSTMRLCRHLTMTPCPGCQVGIPWSEKKVFKLYFTQERHLMGGQLSLMAATLHPTVIMDLTGWILIHESWPFCCNETSVLDWVWQHWQHGPERSVGQ